MKKNLTSLAVLAVALLSSSFAFAQLEAQTQAEDAARIRAVDDAARNRANNRVAPPTQEVQRAPQNNYQAPPRAELARPSRPINPGYSNNYRRDDHDYRRNDRRYDSNNYYRYDERRVEPRYQLRRGGYLPPQYRNNQYVVNDWRGHRLNRPPAGYHWVQVGGDYVLVAITTGIILQLLLNN